MGRKERIEHRKPWTFGTRFKRGDVPDDVLDTYYEMRFNKDYVLRNDDGEVVAISSSKKRLRRTIPLDKKTPTD